MIPTGAQLVEAQNYARPIAVRILRRCPEDVSDVLQQAVINALAGEFRGESQFNSYFTRIVINTALMHLRHQRKGNPYFVDVNERTENGELRWEPVANAPSPERLAYAAEIRAVVESELAEMSPSLRSGVGMIVGNLGQDGRGYTIGRCITSTEKARCFRARRALRERFRAEGMA